MASKNGKCKLLKIVEQIIFVKGSIDMWDEFDQIATA
jgi:hypothetical protein